MPKEPTQYIDNRHPVRRAYFAILNQYTGSNLKTTREKLDKIIEKDPTFLDPYLMLMEIELQEDNIVAARDMLEVAYQQALKAILDKNGNWPDELAWGWQGNRHIIRTLLNKAIFFWTQDEHGKALELFANLLRTNPDDNVGVRFYILAIRKKMSFDEYENRFVENGVSGMKLIRWFDQNYKKHPEDFKEWAERAGVD